MENITEQSIVDKFNVIDPWYAKINRLPEVICHIIDYSDNKDMVFGFKEFVVDNVVFGYRFSDSNVYIKITSIKGTVCVFSGYKYSDFRNEGWLYDGEVKEICLKVIDNILDSHIAKKQREEKLWQEKLQKQKEIDRNIVENFIDRRRTFWNFLFNWMK